MSYLALYRVFRPARFDEMVGQEQTVTALKNAVREGKIAHAYLLSGPRGTGKTSVAKLMAKAVNCLQPEDGEPCNRCAACRDINAGAFMDVIEIDAASNRGIDEIRDLREKIRILPAQGSKKVYIIDEVHMLTTEAFNALLKTLEEPPGYAMFILATTELHKIPGTILSRCQRYSFKNLSQLQISGRLMDVASQSGINLHQDAAELMARRANGGMRDALAMLDQLNAYREGEISLGDVMDVLGLFDEKLLALLVDRMQNDDLAGLVELLDQTLAGGRDGGQLLKDLSLYLRDMLVHRLSGGLGSCLLVSPQGQADLARQAGISSSEGLLQAVRVLMEAVEKLKFSEERRFYIELSLFAVSRALTDQDGPASQEAPKARPLAPRAAATGRASTAGTSNPPSASGDSIDSAAPAREHAAASAPAASAPPAFPDRSGDEFDPLVWNRILGRVKELKVTTFALLKEGQCLGFRDEAFYVAFRKGFKFHRDKMAEKGNQEIAAQAIRQELGREARLELVYLDEQQYNDIIVQKAIELFGEDIVTVKD